MIRQCRCGAYYHEEIRLHGYNGTPWIAQYYACNGNSRGCAITSCPGCKKMLTPTTAKQEEGVNE